MAISKLIVHEDTQYPNYKNKLAVQDKHALIPKQVVQVVGHILHYLVTWSPYSPVPQFCTHNLCETKAKYGDGHCATHSLYTYSIYPDVTFWQDVKQVQVSVSP